MLFVICGQMFLYNITFLFSKDIFIFRTTIAEMDSWNDNMHEIKNVGMLSLQAKLK